MDMYVGKESGLFNSEGSSKVIYIDSKKLQIGVKYVSSTHRIKMTSQRVDDTHRKMLRSRLNGMRSRSLRKNIECSLLLDDIDRLVHSPCIYCGAHNKLSEIDRKDSELGYTLDNTVAACRRCNTLKNHEITFDEMIRIADFLGWRKDS